MTDPQMQRRHLAKRTRDHRKDSARGNTRVSTLPRPPRTPAASITLHEEMPALPLRSEEDKAVPVPSPSKHCPGGPAL